MCIIRATSKAVSFQRFATSTQLPILWAEEPHEMRAVAPGDGFSGKRILIPVCSRDCSDVDGRVVETIEFLRRWRDELQRLAEVHDLDRFDLEFPICAHIGDKAVSRHDRLPPELILLAGEIGLRIELSYSPP